MESFSLGKMPVEKLLDQQDYSNKILLKLITFGNCSRKQCKSILSHFYPLSVTGFRPPG